MFVGFSETDQYEKEKTIDCFSVLARRSLSCLYTFDQFTTKATKLRLWPYWTQFQKSNCFRPKVIHYVFTAWSSKLLAELNDLGPILLLILNDKMKFDQVDKNDGENRIKQTEYFGSQI